MPTFVKRIAWRFMLRGTEKGTFTLMTLFVWLAVGVGVGAMSSLLSVMYGFEATLREKVLKAYPHVIIRPTAQNARITEYQKWTEKWRSVSKVKRVIPYLETEMIAQSDRRALGAVVWGMPLEDFTQVQEGLSQGKLPSVISKLPQVVLGVELAHRLDAEVGSHLRLISAIETQGMMGAVPQAQLFEVAGIYSSGHYDFDQQYVFLLLEDAQDLLKANGGISGWHIWAKDIGQSEDVLASVSVGLPVEWEAQSWRTLNAALFQSLKLEQYAMFTILSFAILIAVMNIVITLTMHVIHKKRNIGILRALGASSRDIRKIFFWQGAFLGGVGLVIGAGLSTAFIVYVKYFSDFQLPDIYYDRSIPIEIRPWSLFAIFGVAVILIFLSTILPAKKAAELDPIEAIRE